MGKINKYINHPIAICNITVAVILFILFIFNFSQMIIETSAYSLILQNTKTINTTAVKTAAGLHSLNQNKSDIYDTNNTKENKKINTNENQTDSDENVVEVNQMNLSDFLIKPVENGVTTSLFGDIVDRTATHLGHDWAVDVGTNVVAAADGIVEKAYLSDSYGYNILISHGNGLETRYAHLSKILVEVGSYVKMKQLIAYSGNTGDSTGPHLHFEVIKDGIHVNPLNYIKK